MKKLLYFAMALGLVACQAEKVDVNGGANEVETNYLSVRIKTANLGTRAEGDYTANGGQYVDGTAAENAVGQVRFYFFDAEENAAVVKYDAAGNKSYYDWDAKGSGTDHTNSVEKILDAVVVINTKEQDKIPASIVAVLNPGLVENLPTQPSLAELNKIVQDFSLTTALTDLSAQSNSFLMTNSVYANGTTKVEAVDIAGHTYSTEAAALLNPVVIYVERVLAKVSMTTDDDLQEVDGMENTYDTQKTVGEGEGAKKIYVKFLGWNTTATADMSNMMKDINPAEWTNNLKDDFVWNWDDHRSFWAINPKGVNVVYGPFRAPKEGEAPNVAQALKVNSGVSYPQENAAKDNSGATTLTPTQVIIAAQLVDESGEPFEVAEYAGKLYAGTQDVRQLIANAANIYKHSTTQDNDGGTQQEYVKIKPEDLTFVTASAEAGKKPEEMTSPRYVVYFVIDEKVEGPLYKLTDTPDDEGKPVFAAYENTAAANAELKKLGSAKVWAEGNTYYYFDIRHLGTNPTGAGYYGVVRNHVYRTNVKSLIGLGTPVYNPDEVIVPEKPQNDDTVIAAQIEILSWRIVDNDYDLNWE